MEEETGKSDNLATGGVNDSKAEEARRHLRHKHKHFKWAPQFKDVHESVEQAPPGNDGWAVKEGFVRYVFLVNQPTNENTIINRERRN